MAKVLRVKKFPLYDVFVGEGWRNWSRVRKVDNGFVIVAGAPLAKEIAPEIMKGINENR